MCLNSLKLGHGFRDRFSINNAIFLQMNLFRPPLRDETFDLVISNGVLHHTSDPEAGYRAILRKVRSGGFILIGLYNYFGRLHTLWRRRLIETFGKGVAILDARLRRLNGADEQYTAWYRDQYEHPHESRHSIDEVLRWFQDSGVDFISCIPTIGDSEFSDQFRLFEQHSSGSYLDRLSTQWDMEFGELALLEGPRHARKFLHDSLVNCGIPINFVSHLEEARIVRKVGSARQRRRKPREAVV